MYLYACRVLIVFIFVLFCCLRHFAFLANNFLFFCRIFAGKSQPQYSFISSFLLCMSRLFIFMVTTYSLVNLSMSYFSKTTYHVQKRQMLLFIWIDTDKRKDIKLVVEYKLVPWCWTCGMHFHQEINLADQSRDRCSALYPPG